MCRFNLSVSGPPGRCHDRQPSLADALASIRDLNLGERAAGELASRARSLPQGALGHFMRNLRNYLRRPPRQG